MVTCTCVFQRPTLSTFFSSPNQTLLRHQYTWCQTLHQSYLLLASFWEEVRKKCADILFFHQTRFIACLQWKALWFNTSVSSKDSSKIPYFPDFIMRSGCSTLYTFREDCYTFIECLIRLTSCECNSKDIHILACTRLPYPLNRQILILSTTLVSL